MPSPLSSIGEFFFLRRAERTIRSYAPEQHVRIALHRAAGDRRRRAAIEASDPLAASVLFRDAVRAYLRAQVFAVLAHAPDEALTNDWLAGRIADVPADVSDAQPEADRERVRGAVRAEDPLFFDGLDRDELERTRSALERAAAALGHGLEARSLANVQGSRVGRIAGILLLAGFIAQRAVSATYWPNLAYGKPVTGSSSFPGQSDFQGLVDGEVGTSYGAATQLDASAWLAVDLQHVFRLTTIKVYNRVDGWFDEDLPLIVQISVDGLHFSDVARRDTSFGHSPPWIVHLDHEKARFVRVRAVNKTVLALSELEVFGDRQEIK